MKKLTKIVALVLAVAMLSAFTDVPKKHWAYTYVTKAQSLGIVKGVSEKLFKPDTTITKQEICQILINIYGKTNPISQDTFNACVSESSISLQQAKITAWANPVVAYGLVNGFWDLTDFKAPIKGSSGGSSIVSRQMMARWICNTMGYKTFGLRVISYKDRNDIDPAYYAYVDSLYRYGIMQGSDTGFQPNDGMTRAHAATVGVNIAEKDKTTTLAKNPFVYESGTITSVDSTQHSFVIGSKILQIASDAKIILDGKAASFEEVAKLNGKKVIASLYLAGENTNSVILQTKPNALNGVVDKITVTNIPEKAESGYKVITITVNGVTADYVIDSNTEVLSTLNVGNNVQFITDGIYVLEIK